MQPSQTLQKKAAQSVYANNKRKVTINPNKAIASVKAKPNKANVKSFSSISGLLLTAVKKPLKIVPIPAPAPEIDVTAIPAAKALILDFNILLINLK